MTRCYSEAVSIRQPSSRRTLPRIWLISDARNDSVLESALRRLPRGSGFVFRHYHLTEGDRATRYATLARIARAMSHCCVVSGTHELARRWRADGVYAPSKRTRSAGSMLAIATAHSLAEIGAAQRNGADIVFLSPVFPTRSHSGQAALGPVRARLLARQAHLPVAMLGGVDARRARGLAPYPWAAIDGLSLR